MVIDGHGITVDQVTPREVDLVVAITVAADADTGRHAVRVTNDGGTSNPGYFSVTVGHVQYGPVFRRLTPSCPDSGRGVHLTLEGEYFEIGAQVKTETTNAIVKNVRFVSPEKLDIEMDIFPSEDRTVSYSLNEIGGSLHGSFGVDCRLTPLSLISLNPATVVRGSRVFVTCTGTKFCYYPSDHVCAPNVDVQAGIGTFAQTYYSSNYAVVNHQVAVRLIVGSGTPEPITIRVGDQLGDFSNALQLSVTDPPPGQPFVSADLNNGIIRGTHNLDYIYGANLQGVTNILCDVPGLTFSVNPARSGDTSIEVDVTCDPSTPLPGDQPANIIVQTTNGVSNPFAYVVH